MSNEKDETSPAFCWGHSSGGVGSTIGFFLVLVYVFMVVKVRLGV